MNKYLIKNKNIQFLKKIKSKLILIIFILMSLTTLGNLSFSLDKVKIEYFGREDCKNCENLKKFLEELSVKRNDIDIIELNEAFAAQSLACIRAWGLDDNDSRINPNGGAIALGHPLGMSGTRITYSAALELQKTKKKYALATMCIGVGQGYAMILENVNL